MGRGLRPAAAWIWARARRARRDSGTAAGSSASRRPRDERDPDHRPTWGSSRRNRCGRGGGLGPAVADHREHGDLPALPGDGGDAPWWPAWPTRRCCGRPPPARGRGRPRPGRAGRVRGAWRPCPRRAAARPPACWSRRRRGRPRSPARARCHPVGTALGLGWWLRRSWPLAGVGRGIVVSSGFGWLRQVWRALGVRCGGRQAFGRVVLRR